MLTPPAHRAFWTLVVVAAIAMGVLSSALTQHAGVLTGLTVAASGSTVLVSLVLAGRVMIALDLARRRDATRSVSTQRQELP